MSGTGSWHNIYKLNQKQTIPMKKIMFSLLAAGALAFMASCGNTNTPDDSKEVAENQNEAQFDNTKLEKDSEFAVKAADGGMMEVMMGELAQKNSTMQELKDYGKMLVTDHSKANEELKALAAQKNISLPAAMSSDHQKKYDDMAKKIGQDFDKDFIDMMIDDHEDDIDLFKDEADNGNDADIKAFASKTLPTLQQHLDRIKQIKDMRK